MLDIGRVAKVGGASLGSREAFFENVGADVFCLQQESVSVIPEMHPAFRKFVDGGHMTMKPKAQINFVCLLGFASTPMPAWISTAIKRSTE